MKSKGKSFDCVEMKNEIQQDLLLEYEARKKDFETYAEFIRSTADEDLAIVEFRKKMAVKWAHETSRFAKAAK
ncbi:MAG: hypothetical protein JXR49_04455 [Acidobacteria bacterium]|nr:hypothetical protein [Acidobacteriota bacterium]